MERILIPWNEMPRGVVSNLPEGIGLIDGSMMVKTADAKNLFHSHYFVFGFANPLLQKKLILSGLIGLLGSIYCLVKNKSQSFYLKSFALMNWINIINPISWIMGLCWYIPLFLYSYTKVRQKYKYLICLPLILPPFLNLSGYFAALISLFITQLYSREGLTT